MNKEEMEEKRNELAVLWCKDHQFSEKDRGDSFKDGWDACANEYEIRIQKLRQALKDINKEELKSQRPGGEYSKSARISYEALLADEE